MKRKDIAVFDRENEYLFDFILSLMPYDFRYHPAVKGGLLAIIRDNLLKANLVEKDFEDLSSKDTLYKDESNDKNSIVFDFRILKSANVDTQNLCLISNHTHETKSLPNVSERFPYNIIGKKHFNHHAHNTLECTIDGLGTLFINEKIIETIYGENMRYDWSSIEETEKRDVYDANVIQTLTDMRCATKTRQKNEIYGHTVLETDYSSFNCFRHPEELRYLISQKIAHNKIGNYAKNEVPLYSLTEQEHLLGSLITKGDDDGCSLSELEYEAIKKGKLSPRKLLRQKRGYQ